MSQHSPDTPQTPLLGNGTLRSLGIVPYLGRLLFLQVVRSMLHTSYNPWSRWPDSQKTGWDCHGFCVWRRQILADVPVLLSAIASKPDWLLTHNAKHFTKAVAQRTSLRIATPAGFFRALSALFR